MVKQIARVAVLAATVTAVLAASAAAPTARAEVDGSVAIGCEFLFASIDGNPNDVPFNDDFVEACDGIDAADVANLANALGDKDDVLESADFAAIDLDANQIQSIDDAGNLANIFEWTYVFAFVDNDGTVSFDAEIGLSTIVQADGTVGESLPPEDASSETCEGDDDLDCGTTTLDNGDGVVVAILLDATADEGDLVDVDIFQADDTAQISTHTVQVTGLPDEITITATPKTVIQTSDSPQDCEDDSDFRDSTQPNEPNRTLVRATVLDRDDRQLARAVVRFASSNEGVATIDDDNGEPASHPKATSSVAIDLSPDGNGALAIVCGGSIAGTALISATINDGQISEDDATVLITTGSMPASIELTADPSQFVCDGVNTSTITATVRDTTGQLVADGSPVNFSVTSVGIVNPINTTTTNGVATTTFTGFAASSVGVPVIVTSVNAQSSILIQCIGFDTDGDGMPNAFEVMLSCLNPNAPDSANDHDADTLSSLNEYQRSLNPCIPDTDTDGCTDGQELTLDEQAGGERDPLNFWDFYDVNGTGNIDLLDTLAILDRFGAEPGDANYDVKFDRSITDQTKPWRTSPAVPAQIGIDLIDALVNLESFGHSCL